MSEVTTKAENAQTTHSRVARFIHRVPLLVVVAWLALTVVVNVVVPQLEEVGKAHSVSLAAKDAQSYMAIKKQGANFEQFDSDSMVMVLLEGDEPLGDQARTYYHGLVEKLRADTEHVEYVQDFWGDRITAGGAQSMDDKAAYVQLNLVGDQGTTRAFRRSAALRNSKVDGFSGTGNVR